ncbi:MAG: hypothetical protein Ct9H300mP26_5630 [Acidimicrobiales bacterium]|nr:MAG: hypothetical protein Ct9H300mP26_5630 [Acidimicrobiales bacterium]
MYPPSLQEPYRTNRYELGEAMYEKLGIPREDKPARLAHLARNFDFFGAPAAFFFFIERNMGAAQWSDLGCSCRRLCCWPSRLAWIRAQEAWANHWSDVQEFCGAPAQEMLFCGMAIGRRDESKPVNSLRSDRMVVDEWTTWL